jgi:hypothetical protein
VTTAVAPVAEPPARARLRWDTPYYSENCLKIVTTAGMLVPFVWKPEQVRLFEALEAQRAAGQPQRAIILKARKLGFSTATQAMIVQRATQRQYHRALVVAQDGKTAGELFDIGKRMYDHLPGEEESGYPWLKPAVTNQRKSRMLAFGEPSREARNRGDVGLDAQILVDTAQEVEAGRGFTYHSLHLSEVAFWPDVKKMTALLNAVPDEPNTLIVKESTANGFNHFKEDWDRAENGESDYMTVFSPWFAEPSYFRRFLSDNDRETFIASIGAGPWGEDEPALVELGITPEQLHWRRWCIVNKNDSDLETFHQEYPSTPEEAFLSTGKRVFSPTLVRRVIDRTDVTDPRAPSEATPGPEMGSLRNRSTKERQGRHGRVVVPQEPYWTPGSGLGSPWRVWERPDAGFDEQGVKVRDAGRYLVAVDPAGADDTEDGSANHAIQVIDHRTLQQVAEAEFDRADPDEVAIQAYLAAVHWNDAWLAFETTGGYGLSMARMCWQDFAYPFLYFRKSVDDRAEKQRDRLGWDTNRVTKRLLEDGGKELLRAERDGIRSRRLAGQMLTYVEHRPGRTGPEKGKVADLLMAWLIAQEIAREKPIRPERKASSSSTMHYTPRDPRTGY